MTTCELRLKAAAVIREKGWCQGDYQNQNGAVCLLGALKTALRLDVEAADIVGRSNIDPRLEKALIALDFEDETADGWNDDPDRTKRQVLARLTKGCKVKVPTKRKAKR